jgi:hypothetical protein
MMLIKTRVSKLIKTATESHQRLLKGLGNGFDGWLTEQKKLSKELDAIDKLTSDVALQVREPVIPYRVLKFGVADGYAHYIITKVRKNEVVVTHLPLGDAYQFVGAYVNDRDELVIPRRVAERILRYEDVFGR